MQNLINFNINIYVKFKCLYGRKYKISVISLSRQIYIFQNLLWKITNIFGSLFVISYQIIFMEKNILPEAELFNYHICYPGGATT